jgi:hypothetical protein
MKRAELSKLLLCMNAQIGYQLNEYTELAD